MRSVKIPVIIPLVVMFPSSSATPKAIMQILQSRTNTHTQGRLATARHYRVIEKQEVNGRRDLQQEVQSLSDRAIEKSKVLRVKGINHRNRLDTGELVHEENHCKEEHVETNEERASIVPIVHIHHGVHSGECHDNCGGEEQEGEGALHQSLVRHLGAGIHYCCRGGGLLGGGGFLAVTEPLGF